MQKILDLLLATIALVRELLARRNKDRTDTVRDAVAGDPAGLLIDKLGGQSTASHPNPSQRPKTDGQRG